MKKMKKTCYIKPEVRVHWLIVECDMLGTSYFGEDDAEVDDMGAKRLDHIIEDDEDEGYY